MSELFALVVLLTIMIEEALSLRFDVLKVTKSGGHGCHVLVFKLLHGALPSFDIGANLDP